MSKLSKLFKQSLQKLIPPILDDYFRAREEHNDRGIQVLLRLQYQQMLQSRMKLPSFDDVQFRAYSQTGEDGILLYVFSLLGTTNKRVVEICAGNGRECNAANLIINHGWHGLLFDGDEKNIAEANSFYSRCRETPVKKPICTQAWITADNINDLIRRAQFDGDIDLLSLDIDGNDYWIWNALDCINPRVIILEYENAWGWEHAVTQPYVEDFVWRANPLGLPSAGASLPAFVKLGRQKGYRLVGCNRMCYNAVFVRNDIGVDVLPEVETSECFNHPLAIHRIKVREEYQRHNSLDVNWITV